MTQATLRIPGLFITSLITILLLLAAAVSTALATADLPPRPTVESPDPVATPVTTPLPPVAAELAGATIMLYAPNASPQMWTVVEWQDGLGNWHEVTGWRGHLDLDIGNLRVWWVHPRDLATGPFRWQLYANEGGPLVATSETFFLPEQPYQVVLLSVE